ncbi:hypothetical protein N7466_008440 [Penicillium verhagenii]|uniref:uncharacterized protein n=1 Tax=Penicillium verhagenii TaxID=1562060 RepID=UPI00254531CB|nr:uncharacterized protein N7466_008440 [Penicillium verhagenii]KAJ5924253.1 hypothetical protein N7466_008440 [Penicillium verhagenii]
MTETSAAALSALERPVTAVLRESRPPSRRDERRQEDDREALELQEIQTREDDELECSSASASSGDEYRVPTSRIVSRVTTQRSHHNRTGLWSRICRFWTHHVTLTVPRKSNRDHYALERTFLAYIRTSVVIAMQGVVIAQLFRLQRAPTAEDRLRFYQVGIPLAVSCHCVAVIVALIGAYRFWRQQSAISLGKVHAGGWELNSVGILLFAIILVTLIVSVTIMVEIDDAQNNLLKRILRR